MRIRIRAGGWGLSILVFAGAAVLIAALSL